MACPTCDGIMETICTGEIDQKILWCTRCGTLKIEYKNNFINISPPSCIRSKAFLISGQYVLKDLE